MTRRAAGRADGRPRTLPAAPESPGDTRSGRVAARVAALAAVLTVGTVLGAGLVAPPPAGAAPSDTGASATDSVSAHPLRVTVSRLDPRTVTPGAVIEIAGTLVNDSTDTWTDVELRLQRGERISTRAGLTADVDDPGDATAAVAPFRPVDGAELAPGDSAQFSYTTTAEELQIGADGVYPVLVNVNGVRAGGSVERAGELWTHLVAQSPPAPTDPTAPAAPTSPGTRTSVAWIWPLTDEPHRDAAGAFTDDELAAEVADGGRLDRAVEVLERVPQAPGTPPGESRPAVPVMLAVDPALLEELAVMAAGPYTAGGEQGTGTADAAELLDRLRAVADDHAVAVLPYADVDGDALVAAGLPAVLTRTLPGTAEGTARQPLDDDGTAAASPTTAPGDAASTPAPNAQETAPAGAGAEVVREVLEVEPRTDLAWPVGGTVRTDTLDLLQAGGAGTVVLAEQALVDGDRAVGQDGDPADASGTLSTAGGDVTTLVVDGRLADAVAGATPDSGVGRLAEQRYLAELGALDTQLAERAPGTPQTVLVVPPRLVDPDVDSVAAMITDTAAQPWLTPVPVASLTEGPPAAAGELVPGAEAFLPAEGMAAIAESARVRDDFAAAVDDPGTVLAGYDAALARAASGQWRGDTEGFADAVAQLGETMAELREQVTLLAPVEGTYSLASSSAPLILTVQNDLPFAVQVRLELRTRGAVGLTTEDIGVQTLPPLSRTPLEVPTQVRQSGGFAVTALLTTPGGVPLGEPVQMQVKSTVYGPITLVLTIGAAGLLGLLFLRRGVLFLLKRRRGEAGDAPAAHGVGSQPPTRSPV
ncbi:DUF6049 family protein [Modestobacter italicus]|uniref:DUF6049 family protein n=1 Tax=Modestobacter italicus (strain DSM 44449 / CECT 9708 / BC 501) TaxID=2732864 RepID=UPI001C985DFF|nr:DUF6049 family protein [Modestobacter italicus]